MPGQLNLFWAYLSLRHLARHNLRNVKQALRAIRTSSREKFDLKFNDSYEVQVNGVTSIFAIYFHIANSFCHIISEEEESEVVKFANFMDQKLFSTLKDQYDWTSGSMVSGKEGLLYLLIRQCKPNLSIETGVAQGVSSSFMLRALSENRTGKLVSIDLPVYDSMGSINSDGVLEKVHIREDLDAGWAIPETLRNKWELLLGRSDQILPTLNYEVDLFFHDSEHSYKNMMFEYNWARDHIKKPGIICSDDTQWNSAFDDFRKAYSEIEDMSLGVESSNFRILLLR